MLSVLRMHGALKTTIQVTNVSPLATTEQMKELFSYLGDIAEIKLYPEE